MIRLGGILLSLMLATGCSSLPASCPVVAITQAHDRLSASYDAELGQCVERSTTEVSAMQCMHAVEERYATAWELYKDTTAQMRSCQGN